MKLARFAQNHPYWFVVILEVMVIAVYLAAGTVAYIFKLPNLTLYGLANLGLTIFLAVLLTLMGWWKTIGFRSPERRSDLLYFFVAFIPMFINFIPGVEIKSAAFVAQVFAVTLMVGFVEETIFRGLMINALKPHGHWRAVIVSALLFGLTHAMNVMTGKDVKDAVLQVLYALAIGFAFGALFLKTKILWPLVLAHFLIDFVNFIQKLGFVYPPFWEMVIVIGTIVVFIAYGFFIILQRQQLLSPVYVE